MKGITLLRSNNNSSWKPGKAVLVAVVAAAFEDGANHYLFSSDFFFPAFTIIFLSRKELSEPVKVPFLFEECYTHY